MIHLDKMSTSTKYGIEPFICHKIPLVGKSNPHGVMFVGYKIPSVCFHYFGFTLIELIVTVTLIGILAAIAAPGMQGIILDQRLSSQVNDTLADLSLARSEAIRRAMRITVCKSSNPTATSPTCDTNTANPWTTGRVVFVDGGTVGTIDSSDTILRIKDVLDGANTSSNRMLGDSTTGNPARITYLSTGLIDVTTAGETQLRLCDKRGTAYGRAIVITNTGRVRVAPRGQDRGGNALSCS